MNYERSMNDRNERTRTTEQARTHTAMGVGVGMVRFRVPPKRTEASVRSDASPAQVAVMISVLFCGFRPSAVVHYGFAVLCLLFVLLVSCPVSCQETLTNRMRVISEDLDRQLNGIMASQSLNYTTVNMTKLDYNATTKFNPKGMGQLYNVTNMFIDFVQSKQAYPEGESRYSSKISVQQVIL